MSVLACSRYFPFPTFMATSKIVYDVHVCHPCPAIPEAIAISIADRPIRLSARRPRQSLTHSIHYLTSLHSFTAAATVWWAIDKVRWTGIIMGVSIHHGNIPSFDGIQSNLGLGCQHQAFWLKLGLGEQQLLIMLLQSFQGGAIRPKNSSCDGCNLKPKWCQKLTPRIHFETTLVSLHHEEKRERHFLTVTLKPSWFRGVNFFLL